MLNTLLPPNYALISWRFPGPGVGVAGDRVLALAVPCPMPRAVAVVAARREGAVRMDMVAREAVGAFVDELRRDWPRVVRAFWRTTTPAPPAPDESEALRVHGRAHPGDVVARFRGLWSTAASRSSISSSRVLVGRSRQTTEGHTRRQTAKRGRRPPGVVVSPVLVTRRRRRPSCRMARWRRVPGIRHEGRVSRTTAASPLGSTA